MRRLPAGVRAAIYTALGTFAVLMLFAFMTTFPGFVLALIGFTFLGLFSWAVVRLYVSIWRDVRKFLIEKEVDS